MTSARPNCGSSFRLSPRHPFARLAFLATLLGAFALPALGASGDVTWAIDPVHSSAEFSIAHLVVSHVKGVIPIKSGTIVTAAGKDLPRAVEATLDPSAVDTRNADRDRDLRSEHYFDAQKYATMAFKSTKITYGESGSFRVDGLLTLHGVTRPIVLDAHLEGKTSDARGTLRIAYTATTKFPRSDFGMTYTTPVPTGGVVVGNDVDVTLSIEATPKRPG